MIIYFIHGQESGPWGTKIKFLAKLAVERGWQVESPDFTSIAAPDARASRLIDILEPGIEKQFVVGSSMGGYAALKASYYEQVEGVFLLAPALYLSGYRMQEFAPACCPVEIVHGWRDTVVPPEHSIRFAQSQRCPLHLVDDDHRLSGDLNTLGGLFLSFLRKLTPPPDSS